MASSSSSIPEEQLEQINTSLRRAGGHYEGYSCKKTVPWVDDIQLMKESLPSSGGTNNVIDSRLLSRDGRLFFTVQRNDWNERLGKVAADDISVVTGSSAAEEAGEGVEGGGTLRTLQSCTLRSILQNPSKYAGYSGLRDPSDDLHDDSLDREIFVRFQITFLPLRKPDDDFGSIGFLPKAFGGTHWDVSRPQNLILLSTAQGLGIQNDGGPGSTTLFHHSPLLDGGVSRHWLQAEPSRHKVGCSEEGTKKEVADKLKCGNSVASTSGVVGMEGRSYAVMIIQIPLLKGKDEAPPDTMIQPVPNDATKDMVTNNTLQEALQETLQALFWLALLPFVALFLFVVDSFGTPKHPSANIVSRQQGKQSTTTTQTKLLEAIKVQERRAIHIKMKRDCMVAEAKARMAKGDKKGALLKMRCKKMYEYELDKIEATQLRLEAQVTGTAVRKIRTEVGIEKAVESWKQEEEMETALEVNIESSQQEDALLVDHDAYLTELERLETCDLGGGRNSKGNSNNNQEINHDLEAQEIPLGDACPDDWLLVQPTPHLPTRRSFGGSSTCKVSKGPIADFQESGVLLSVADPRRHPKEHIIVTVVMCRVCSDSIPSDKDVKAAVDDIEEMYNTVEESGDLANEDFALVDSIFPEGDTTEDLTELEAELEELLPRSSPGLAIDEEEDSLGGGPVSLVLSSAEKEELRKLEEELAGL